MSLLLIPVVVAAVFALPLLMARLEPSSDHPSHRGDSRRRTARISGR